MKIIAYEVEQWESEFLETISDRGEIRCVSERLTEKSAEEHRDAEIISIFVYSKAGRDALEKFKNLKMIATRSTGFDHIDMDYCKERGIAVTYVPSYGENTVAEHVFALLLTISHRMVEAIDRTRRGDFSTAGLRGFDLQGKTIGVIGTGNIGLHTIRIARGFDMEVLAFDVKPKEDLAREMGFRYADLNEVLAQSDIVTLHVPASPKTENLISNEQFDAMKDGAILINTARGTVVDNRALLDALSKGKIAAAGLDVLPEEPTIREEAELLRSVFNREHNMETLLTDHILLRLRNVVITPHNAFNTDEAVRRILETTVENIRAFQKGEPKNMVT
jgi:D-lactate dehydrogenase